MRPTVRRCKVTPSAVIPLPARDVAVPFIADEDQHAWGIAPVDEDLGEHVAEHG